MLGDVLAKHAVELNRLASALEQPEGERTTMDLEEHPVSACNPSPTLG